MTKILDGYHQFLDKWGFRQAFPTDSSLFQAIGYRTYFFWQRIVEQTRMDNANDGLAISGWESTTIDNHSGLVDNHRFFKGDPKVIAEACQPEVLVIQPRHVIVAKGGTNLVDVFLINEVNRTGPQTLKLTAKTRTVQQPLQPRSPLRPKAAMFTASFSLKPSKFPLPMWPAC